MKTNGNTIDSLIKIPLLEKIQLLLFCLFVCTLTLDTRANSAFLICLLVSLLFSFRTSNIKQFRVPLLFFGAGFIFSCLGLFWSDYRHEGRMVIERQLALLFLPLMLFGAFNYQRIKFKSILVLFYLSIAVISMYLLKCFAINFLNSHVALKDFTVKENLYHAFARPIGMHATYLSLYVALAIFVGLYWLLENLKWWLKSAIFLSNLILVITLTLLSSRVVIFSLVFIVFFVYPFFIGKLRNKPVLLVGGIAILLTFFFIIRESSFITSRFIDKMDDEVKMTSFLTRDSTYNPIYGGETRADRWYCALELIREKTGIGYGTGSEKAMLMTKYKRYDLQNAVINGYDSHNQYLAYGIKGGVFALTFFIMSVLFGLYISIKQKNFLYLAFILLFASACITENVLESNKGIFFYAFFNTLLCFSCLKNLTPSKEE
ncbi:MAG: O-antigen ligase family protein [bacterium]|nr:O-antigen ligase family protein [bacterium]